VPGLERWKKTTCCQNEAISRSTPSDTTSLLPADSEQEGIGIDKLEVLMALSHAMKITKREEGIKPQKIEEIYATLRLFQSSLDSHDEAWGSLPLSTSMQKFGTCGFTNSPSFTRQSNHSSQN
jgi:hypothetical protein